MSKKPDAFVVHDEANNTVAMLPTKREAMRWAQSHNALQKVLNNATKVWVRPHYFE